MTCTAGRHVFPASPLSRLLSFPILINALFLATMAMPSKSLLRIVSTKKVFSKKKNRIVENLPASCRKCDSAGSGEVKIERDIYI